MSVRRGNLSDESIAVTKETLEPLAKLLPFADCTLDEMARLYFVSGDRGDEGCSKTTLSLSWKLRSWAILPPVAAFSKIVEAVLRFTGAEKVSFN